MGFHRPADDSSTPGVDDDGEKQEPAQVGMYVMSATHNRSGPAAVNCRSTRSGAGRAVSARTVVRNGFRRLTPCRPAPRSSRATRLRPT